MALIKQFSVQLLASLTILNFMGQTESLLITDFVDKIEHIREMKVSQLKKNELSKPQMDPEPQGKDAQTLCFNAKIMANIIYIDDNYIPTWKEYVPVGLSRYKGETIRALYCATMPTIYVAQSNEKSLTGSRFPKRMGIYMLDQYLNTEYVVDKEISTANSVSSVPITEYPDLLEKSTLLKLYIEDRRILCAKASKNVRLDFVGHNVPEAQVYEFEYAEEKEIQVAIACPTIPRSYLLAEKLNNKINVIIIRAVANRYPTFVLEPVKPTSVTLLRKNEYKAQKYDENYLSRRNLQDLMELCSAVAERFSLGLTDAYTIGPHWYSFRYPETDDPVKKEFAVTCPTLPTSYLTCENSIKDPSEISITLASTLADRYSFNAEVVKYVHETNYYKDRWATHPFSKLTQNILWIFCWTACGSIPGAAKISPPGSSKFPAEYEFEYRYGRKVKHFAFECPTKPRMYIREGDLDDIQIVLPRAKFDRPIID